MSSYTPGPWFALEDGVREESTHGYIARVTDGEHPEIEMYDETERRYNASLIAAAPELINVIEDVLSIIQRDAEWNHGETPEDASYIVFESTIINAIEDDIKSVLAKAKGESDD